MHPRRLMTSLILYTLFASIAGCNNANCQVAQPPTEAPKPPGRMVDIGGRRLHLHCTGTGTPTVIVENGGGSFTVDWALVQPAVSQFTRICTYDRAGYAWSDPGPLRDLPEQIMADLELLLRLGDVKPPYVLVGQSIGGLFIRDYQRRFPEQVGGMVLVDPTHEDHNAYIIDGKPKPIPFVTREELQQFTRNYLANHPPITIPVRVGSPYDRLPAEVKPVRLWAMTNYVKDLDVSQTPFMDEGQREEAIALRNQRLSQKHPMGKIPLMVVTNGQNALKAGLAELSEGGEVIAVPDSCHEVQICSPPVVIHAIEKVVNSVRGTR
jgi:pimeloyl-ACP methyl ester carboxylesterase